MFAPLCLTLGVEADKHKSLTHELTQVRKEKQERFVQYWWHVKTAKSHRYLRIKERAFLAQEHSSYQLACQQIYEDSTKHEENAKNLSKKLQVVNKERLKYRHECLENQVPYVIVRCRLISDTQYFSVAVLCALFSKPC